MLSYPVLKTIQQAFSDELQKRDPVAAFERHAWEFTNHRGRVSVQALRGAVFEKACVSEIASTVVLPDRDYETSIEWLGIQIFPANPLVPMLTVVFEQVRERGELRCPCVFDVFPVIPYQDDRLDLSKAIGDVCIKHARPYPDLPESYLRMFRVDDAGMGVGYGIGLALPGQEKNQELYADAAEAIRAAYFRIVDRRKDMAFTQHHASDLQTYRSAMVKFVFLENRFFKGGIQMGIPAESFMLHMLPPSVRF